MAVQINVTAEGNVEGLSVDQDLADLLFGQNPQATRLINAIKLWVIIQYMVKNDVSYEQAIAYVDSKSERQN